MTQNLQKKKLKTQLFVGRMGCHLVSPVMSSCPAVAHKPMYRDFPYIIILAEPLTKRWGNILQEIGCITDQWGLLP